jgi:DNA-binding NtrC family response regulator
MDKPKILCIDDCVSFVETLSMFLEADYLVETANTIGEAEKILKASDFDLVICDGTVSRHQDGAEWAKKKHDEGVPVVILSGDCQSKRDNVPFLLKPVNLDLLERFIRQTLFGAN